MMGKTPDVLFVVKCEKCGHEHELTIVTSKLARSVRRLVETAEKVVGPREDTRWRI